MFHHHALLRRGLVSDGGRISDSSFTGLSSTQGSLDIIHIWWRAIVIESKLHVRVFICQWILYLILAALEIMCDISELIKLSSIPLCI